MSHEYMSKATPKATASGIPVFCAHDAIVPIEKVIPNPKNPNTHPAEQIKLLGRIIQAAGWRQPITVSNRSGFIVKGHGRLLAAKKAGLTEVPVDYQEYANEAEEYADLIADNRLAELSEIDTELLADIFQDIDLSEIPAELTGYTESEINALTAALADELDETVSEEVPVPETKEIVTKPGDIWILGRHRVMCGDCTNKDHREKLLDGATPQILLTDPPYCSGGFQESGRSSGSIGTITKYKYEKRTPTIANDMLSTRGYQALIKQAITGIPCAVAYIFTDWRMWLYLFDLVEGSGFGVRSMIVWNKKAIGMGSGWRSQHELIMFAHRTKTKFDNTKGYGNVLECSRSGNDLHPTQKPVELIEMLLDNTDWCSGVYDPFGGSGTTLIACEKMGQTAYVMELEPKYVDTIVRRFAFVNKKKKMKCIRDNKELSQEEIAPIFADMDDETEE
ncbi:site-specific DNA-methyltransferase [uncultured Megasphaera sp.]|uniref:site-specific DNA-methyltransferase n=1 Tax=uncultured Megasphaera sp. TaxID=165188 RepID=UPI00259375DE|nr:DNA methyltransferase [uncultured Megasphaera sp.]